MKKSLIFLITIAIFPFLFAGHALAADFEVKVNREYFVDDITKVRIVETHTISNKHTDKVIGEDNIENFFVSVTSGNAESLDKTLATVNLTVDGQKVNFTKEIKGDYALLTSKLPRAIKPGANLVFKLEYSNLGLIETKGALTDFYAPGFKEDANTPSSDKTTSYTFDTYVSISQTLPEINFVNPAPVEDIKASGYNRYYFSYASLLNHYVWIQIGRKQYYKFVINQEVNATDTSEAGYENEYRLVVPRDVDEPQIYQKVYFTSINPAPSYVDQDANGNLIMAFRKPTKENSIINIEGFAEVGRNDIQINADTSGDLTNNKLNPLGDYLVPDEYSDNGQTISKYWQVNDPQIQSTAKSVVGGEKNIFTISQKLYDFVIGKIDYSKVKRFGLNERQGALKTLNGGAAVCMEYSDLFLALSRASGVPTRAVFGYGYDSKIQNDKQEAHQWVETYMPNLDKWVSIDVTWGESGMKMAEGNLNHFFTHIASINPDTPALVERRTFSVGTVELKTPQFSIEAENNILDPNTQLTTQNQLLSQYPKPVDAAAKATNFLADFVLLKWVNTSTIMVCLGILLMLAAIVGIMKMMRNQEK